MPNNLLQQAIKEAYASCPSDTIIYHTLEIKHPDFIDDNGNPTTIRIVQGFHGIIATLETGEKVSFQAMCFDIELPPVDTSAVPEISIEFDNVSQEIIKHLDNAASSQHKTELIYRPYLSNDLSTPQMIPPINLTITEINCDIYKITAKARMTDIGNKIFPNETYRLSKFIGLIA